MRIIEKKPKVRILRLRHVPIIDATGLQSLRQFYEKCRVHHVRLFLTGVRSQPLRAMKNTGFYDRIGGENIVNSVQDAVKRALELAEKKEITLP